MLTKIQKKHDFFGIKSKKNTIFSESNPKKTRFFRNQIQKNRVFSGIMSLRLFVVRI